VLAVLLLTNLIEVHFSQLLLVLLLLLFIFVYFLLVLSLDFRYPFAFYLFSLVKVTFRSFLEIAMVLGVVDGAHLQLSVTLDMHRILLVFVLGLRF